jgi:hypothetical protein
LPLPLSQPFGFAQGKPWERGGGWGWGEGNLAFGKIGDRMTSPTTYLSFLIRLWCEPDESPARVAGWRGEVEHIQSGHHWTFDTLDEMLSFLRRQASDLKMLSRSTDGTSPVV